MEGIIYCYTNKINGLKYIGQTTNEQSRRCSFTNPNARYCTSYKQYKEGGKLSKFDQARKDFGLEAFDYEILDIIENEDSEYLIDELNALETYYIKKYDTMNNGYNMTEGGYNGLLSDETKHKISESLKGHKMSELTYQKLCLTGYPHTEESKKKISELAKERYKDITKHPMYGKHHSEESKKKNSESRKGKCVSGENGKARKVLMLSENGDVLKEFSCLKDAAESLGKSSSAGISNCCRHLAYKSFGYCWRYKEEYESNPEKAVYEIKNKIFIPRC